MIIISQHSSFYAELQRADRIKTTISKYAVTMEEFDSDWVAKKPDYVNIAEIVLKYTSKGQTYRYQKAKMQKPSLNGSDFFKENDEDTHPLFYHDNDTCEEDLKKKSPNVVLKNYKPSKKDAELLAAGIYLAEKGRIYSNKELYNDAIITLDKDFEQIINLLRTGTQQHNLRKELDNATLIRLEDIAKRIDVADSMGFV